MGKVIFYATIDRRTHPILRRHILTLRSISSGLVIKASSLFRFSEVIKEIEEFRHLIAATLFERMIP